MNNQKINDSNFFDQNHIWHPYNRLPANQPNLEIASAKGSLLQTVDGRELIDGMSSWWATIHGYNHPTINRTACEQIETLSHVMFGGLTHQPAIELAKKLVEITPKGLDKVFFADSGSVSVEVALKVALQYWKSKNQPAKSKFLALRNGYHGDTFGAMAVCDPINGMHHLFADNLMQNLFAPAPKPLQPGLVVDKQPEDKAEIAELEQVFAKHHQQLAALILEPVVQGAGGMRFYPASYLQAARELCDKYGVLLIADEIATGFGRTGKLFACEWARISPDIICIGKALTGGYLSLAAMLCNAEISDSIGQAQPGLLMHGPTFMANPLACKIASTSIDLLLESDWKNSIKNIENQLIQGFACLKKLPGIKDVRVLGAIGVIELERDDLGMQIQQSAVENGIWIRPFGKLVYTMPAFNIPAPELEKLCAGMVAAVKSHLAPTSHC